MLYDCNLMFSNYEKTIDTKFVVMKKNFIKKQSSDSISTKKNWYDDRYQTIVVQRNFLIILIVLSLAGVIISTLAVINVTSSKNIEPFVIEIEKRTGITNIVRPLLKDKITQDEAITNYFIMKYLNAREAYNPASFEYNYGTVVRLLSNNLVYNEYRKFISSDAGRNPTKLGKSAKRTIKVKSSSTLNTGKVSKGQTIQVRFSTTDENSKKTTNVRHLIATITFEIGDLKLTPNEREINPLNFQVIGYTVDDEII